MASAAPFATIYTFERLEDGEYPQGLTADANGNLFGITINGGPLKTGSGRLVDCGTVFRLIKPVPGATTWVRDVVHNTGQSEGRPDGECYPIGAPVIDGGFLYGTNLKGTTTNLQYGSVFRVALPHGTNKVLHAFDKAEGSEPNGIAMGPDGALYGSTVFGGPVQGCSAGVVFRLRLGGAFHVLHAFRDSGGVEPNNELIFGPDGAIYGTTQYRCKDNQTRRGNVFRITTDGRYSVIHSFTNSDHISYAGGRLVFGADGTLYGTGSSQNEDNLGSVWSLKPGASGAPWAFKVIHRFDEAATGSFPCGLTRDAAGNLYGTATRGGAGSAGLLYRLSAPTAGPAWTFTVLHNFHIRSDGYGPACNPIVVGNVLYGTTDPGPETEGTVFRYDLTEATRQAGSGARSN